MNKIIGLYLYACLFVGGCVVDKQSFESDAPSGELSSDEPAPAMGTTEQALGQPRTHATDNQAFNGNILAAENGLTQRTTTSNIGSATIDSELQATPQVSAEAGSVVPAACVPCCITVGDGGFLCFYDCTGKYCKFNTNPL